MKGQKVFSYKKGQKVPSWVQLLTGGNSDSDECKCVFGSNGKLYLLPNGDILTYEHRRRDRRSSCIYIENAVGVNVIGCGNNLNTFYWFGNLLKRGGLSGCSIARREKGIKVTTKTAPIPKDRPIDIVAL